MAACMCCSATAALGWSILSCLACNLINKAIWECRQNEMPTTRTHNPERLAGERASHRSRYRWHRIEGIGRRLIMPLVSRQHLERLNFRACLGEWTSQMLARRRRCATSTSITPSLACFSQRLDSPTRDDRSNMQALIKSVGASGSAKSARIVAIFGSTDRPCPPVSASRRGTRRLRRGSNSGTTARPSRLSVPDLLP